MNNYEERINLPEEMEFLIGMLLAVGKGKERSEVIRGVIKTANSHGLDPIGIEMLVKAIRQRMDDVHF